MYSKNVKLVPWVGKEYEKTNPKIMILGMSIYDSENNSRKVLHSYIESLIREEWSYAFFTKIQNMFSNDRHWDFISEDNYKLNNELFWNDFCFYEYIQERMNCPKEQTPIEYWKQAEKPFFEVLEKLFPDIVLCLGYEVYNNLPNEGSYYKQFKYSNLAMDTWKYQIKKKEIIVCQIQHPSSVGFNQQKWGVLVEKFIADIKIQNIIKTRNHS